MTPEEILKCARYYGPSVNTELIREKYRASIEKLASKDIANAIAEALNCENGSYMFATEAVRWSAAEGLLAMGVNAWTVLDLVKANQEIGAVAILMHLGESDRIRGGEMEENE